MIGEEDHLRIQVMQAGLELDRAYRTADELDTALDSRLHFAFDDRLGYLTQCPTNLGTGLRVSVMLHLPMLAAGYDIWPAQAFASKVAAFVCSCAGATPEYPAAAKTEFSGNL